MTARLSAPRYREGGAARGSSAVLGIAVLGRDDQPAAGPRAVATIRIGGIPEGATLAAGSVWVAEADGRVLRIDPDTRKTIATVRAGSGATAIAASGDTVWVVSSNDKAHEFRLFRVDAGTDRAVAEIGSFGPFGAVLGASDSAAWVQIDKQAPGPLRRVDPDTNRIEGAFGRRWLGAIAASGDRLWTLSQDGLLEWRDADSGALIGRQPGFASTAPGGSATSAIAPEAQGAWVATGDDGAVTRVASDGTIERRVEVGANGPLALARGALWVTAHDGSGRNAEIVSLDPETGSVTGRVRVGARLPSQLLAVGDELWAVLSDGAIVVIR